MTQLDWIVMSLTLFSIVAYGIWKTRGKKNLDSYLLAGKKAKWWTVGISVMATQASAITFLSTPGQAYFDGMGFAQFYLALPIAMIIICITFIPIFYKLKVYTAYEFLEGRFDLKTRSLTAMLFLFQRGLAAGITIYAPALVLSSILGWNLSLACIITGSIVIIYTMLGGTKAVNVTQKLQMGIILMGMFAVFFVLLDYLPDEYTFSETMRIAGVNGKLNVLDFSFDWNNRYTVWSSLFGATFLFLSYFGTDQSQVQRYLTANSVSESRMGLIFNGLLKVPLQFFILFLGVLVFVFYQFNQAPIFFNQSVKEKLFQSDKILEIDALTNQYKDNFNSRLLLNQELIDAHRENDQAKIRSTQASLTSVNALELQLRSKTKDLIKSVDPSIETNDKDYVFINFILDYMPKGLIGLLIAVIMCAAMSSTASEINALASTSIIDIYKRMIKPDGSDAHYVFASKMATLLWGLVAISFTFLFGLAENLIQFVNIIGSLFYGTILGVFLVAFYIKRVQGNAVFIAALITEALVVFIFFQDWISFLWLNLIGAAGVIIISSLLQSIMNSRRNGNHEELIREG